MTYKELLENTYRLGLNKKVQKKFNTTQENGIDNLYDVNLDNCLDEIKRDLGVIFRDDQRRWEVKNGKLRDLSGNLKDLKKHKKYYIKSDAWNLGKGNYLYIGLVARDIEEAKNLVLDRCYDRVLVPGIDNEDVSLKQTRIADFLKNSEDCFFWILLKSNGESVFGDLDTTGSIEEYSAKEQIPLENIEHLIFYDTIMQNQIAFLYKLTASNLFTALRMAVNALDRKVNRIKNDGFMLDESDLGLNKKVRNKFNDINAIDNISEYVDLGLPSGNLWCKYNYGATSEEDFGDLYNYEEMISLDLKDYLRLPTHSDFVELKNNCDIKEFSINGINGRLLVSRINGNQIFLPASGIVIDGDLIGRNKNGDYWTSTKDTTPGFGGVRTIIFHNTCVFGFSSIGQKNKLSVRCIENKKVNESNLGLASKVKAKHDEIDAIDNISDYVDLGLPSGNLWAKCNVGSDEIQDYGDYMSYDEAVERGLGDSMPTEEDWEELKANCNFCYTEYYAGEGYGLLLSSKKDKSKEIFLPAGGHQYETAKRVFGDGVSGDYLINGMKGHIKYFGVSSSRTSTIIYDDRNVKCLVRLVIKRKN